MRRPTSRIRCVLLGLGISSLLGTGCSSNEFFWVLFSRDYNRLPDPYEVWVGSWETEGHELPLQVLVTLDRRAYLIGEPATFDRATGQFLEDSQMVQDHLSKNQYTIVSIPFNAVAQADQDGNLEGYAYGDYGWTSLHKSTSMSICGVWMAPMEGTVDWRKGVISGRCDSTALRQDELLAMRNLNWEARRPASEIEPE